MTKLEQKVMAGVAVIYVTRRLTSRTAVECYALFLSAFGITLFASLPHVAANLLLVESHGIPAIATYVLSAVTKTNVVVQGALIVGIAALTSFVLDRVQPTRQSNFAQG